MLNLDSIHAFCTVLELGNFRKAAFQLHRTQPAITQQIKRLEEELGQTLLDRTLRAPTPQGKLFYAKGKELLLQARNLAEEISDRGESAARELRVGTSDTNALYFLPPYVSAFSRKWPDIKLEIYSRSTDEIAEEIVLENIDLGIITLPLANTDLETETLFHQQFYLVVPKSHLMSKRKRVSLGKLKHESFVLLDETTRTGTMLQTFFEDQQFTPIVSMYSGSFEVIKRYVVEGIGIAFLPEMVLTSTDRESLATIRVPGLPQVGIGAIRRKGRYQSRAAKSFLKLLTN
ncbi:MAG: LysR family transcriptional regulator [Candidatus Hydrogenedentota bacterium]